MHKNIIIYDWNTKSNKRIKVHLHAHLPTSAILAAITDTQYVHQNVSA
jgi:hypothetical protein